MVKELSESGKRHARLLIELRGLVVGVKDEGRGRETGQKEKQRLKRRQRTQDPI